ncbi:MAG: hypothetical protein PHE72_14700 [candidate division Zixibacteria bacterium]|nr:hypothetical protein [candidate division Zixibacteria bacterium]
MPRITAFGGGNVKLTSFLGEVARQFEQEAQKRTFAAANEVKRAWLGLLSGARHGRIYPIPGSKRKRRAVVVAKRPKGWQKSMATMTGASFALMGGPGTYVASAPGEPPASALGDLRRSIRAVSRRNPLSGEWEALVGSDMEKAPWLEYGTGRAGAAAGQGDLPSGYKHGGSSGMAPRPSLRPALERTRSAVSGILGRPL